VTSIKPNRSPDLSKSHFQFFRSGRFVATNLPLIRIIAAAWNLPFQSQRLTLAPGVKMPREVYDIEATAEEGAFPRGLATEQRVLRMRLMLRTLLEDRFKLRVHAEPQERPVYALVVGKDVLKLEKSKFQDQDCGDNGPKRLTNPACHFLNGGQDVGLRGASVTIAQVVERVQNFTDRPLLDKTGLTGFYDIQTDAWAPLRLRQLDLDGVADNDPNDFERQILFNVFEKLGLRMEPQKAVIDVFVIDHIENPSEN